MSLRNVDGIMGLDVQEEAFLFERQKQTATFSPRALSCRAQFLWYIVRAKSQTSRTHGHQPEFP